ncbi:MAG: M67 family metallopeptidase [Bacteroidetes bacterium]|nr:M67 family metallopeptidase [Bacteroidota bacterium]MDA0903420.1 M67 family metallopeptidase [Bacteroidota bacterium]MDA1241548.1 M67 family metallopeptidase [Bacteroidota bacterium]
MSFLPLDIDHKALKAMTDHAEAAFPNECCGFFYGDESGGIRQVTLSTQVTNSKEGDQRRRFAISDKDYLQAERHAAREGLTLLGVYHSHPLHPAIPSEHDLAVALPFFSYIIVSVEPEGTSHVRSWQLDADRQFAEEHIVSMPTTWRTT